MICERILVPFDGSKYSKRALTAAIEIAKKDKSKIDIISVVNVEYIQPPGSLLGIASLSSFQSTLKKMTASAKKEAIQMLSNHASKCREKGIKTDVKILSGNITEQILKYAKKNKITIIVMGSQGLHGMQKLKILGSTSRKVSELASCPVLIVR